MFIMLLVLIRLLLFVDQVILLVDLRVFVIGLLFDFLIELLVVR